MTNPQLSIAHQQPTRIVLSIENGGTFWEIDVSVDVSGDGGITADITRDGTLCTSAEFGWLDRHDNEEVRS